MGCSGFLFLLPVGAGQVEGETERRERLWTLVRISLTPALSRWERAGVRDRNGLLLGQDFFEPCNDGFYFFVGQHLNADSD